jgi:hypothetical protein
MKKTFIYAAVAAALSMPFTVAAEDLLNGVDGEALANNGAVTIGALSPATNKPVNSYRNTNSNSDNFKSLDAFNEINSDNAVSIGQDGNVIYGNQVDQAVAASDMDAVITGNIVSVNSAYSEAALSPATNKPLNYKADTINKITGSFSGASGIAVVSQNSGHASSIQQGTLVQSNFNLQ